MSRQHLPNKVFRRLTRGYSRCSCGGLFRLIRGAVRCDRCFITANGAKGKKRNRWK